MNTVVRVLPPGRLASARSYIFCDEEFGSGYMRLPRIVGLTLIAAEFLPANRSLVGAVLRPAQRHGPVHAYVSGIACRNRACDGIKRAAMRHHPIHADCKSIRTRTLEGTATMLRFF